MSQYTIMGMKISHKEININIKYFIRVKKTFQKITAVNILIIIRLNFSVKCLKLFKGLLGNLLFVILNKPLHNLS